MSDAGFQRQLTLLRVYAAFTYPFACVPFLWFYFVERGVELSDYRWLVWVYYATMVAAEVPTGFLADRYGRRLPAMLGPVVLAAGFLTIGGFDSIEAFWVGQIAIGLGHSILSGPPSALLFETLRRAGRSSEYLRFESRLHGIRLAGTGVSFLLGGLIAEVAGFRACVLATAPLCLVATLAATALREPQRPGGRPRRRIPILVSAARDLRAPAVAWIVAYYVVLFCLLRYPFHFYQPFLRDARFDAPLFVGTLYFALNVVAAPASRFAPWLDEKLGERIVFWSLPLSLSLSMLLMAGHLDAFGVSLMFVQQVPFGLHWAVVQSFANHRLRDASRATVLSVLSVAGRLGFVAVLPLTPMTDVPTVYLTAGIGGTVLAVACLLLGGRFLVSSPHVSPASERNGANACESEESD